MIDGYIILLAALAYIGFLFALAWMGDKHTGLAFTKRHRPIIYALSLAVYCTSWTFFGSVGLAATTGLGFIPVYVGPVLLFIFGWPLIRRIARLARDNNITSIADFIAARYGKNPQLAALVTIIAVIGTLPYIALQLKAVSTSMLTILGASSDSSVLGDIPLAVALAMAVFTMLFGTRHIDATEHQQGLMLAIATESIIKIIAFITVGLFVTFYMFDGFADLIATAQQSADYTSPFERSFNLTSWITISLLSFVCILLLPRQFHVAIVENNSDQEIKYAAWLFPAYLIAINIFVIPIALAGLYKFPEGAVEADMFVLALPLLSDAKSIALFAFIGGLSAATAMVIVASVALAIMVSNELILPLMVRHRFQRQREDLAGLGEIGDQILVIRRITIFCILMMSYGFYRMAGESYALASIGLLSFSAIAQFAPAFFGGLVWKDANARGAIAGIVTGFAVWAYTLLLPWFAKAGWLPITLLTEGPLGIELLRPQALFGVQMESLTHGVFWSLMLNCIAYVVGSLSRPAETVERLQASAFVNDLNSVGPRPTFRLWRSSVTVQDLERTVARYLGPDRTRRSFQEYADSNELRLKPGTEADVNLLRFTEHLLASAIGAASSRLVLSLLLRKNNVSHRSALRLLDDASEALQYNRDLLQSALDQVRQGIAVFDEDMQLICWNHRFRELLQLPRELGRIGVPIDRILEHLVESGLIENTPNSDTIADRIERIVVRHETFQEELSSIDRVLEIRSNSMPQGGVVVTFSDITDRVKAAEQLKRANETLERRVRERTAELTMVNSELSKAKAKADTANLDKTRFLAAAGHDIMQPLNAARLFASSLVARTRDDDHAQLARNVDASLSAVEDIMNALLDISRLDAGAMKPKFEHFQLSEIMSQLQTEFQPLAAEKGLQLRVVSTDAWVHSDPRLLRRLLQNLLSNAMKYTQSGAILMGCRPRGDRIVFQVCDTGPGIPRSDQPLVFKEFKRLENARDTGLGLGLSIVQRIATVLDHDIGLRSRVGHGTTFSVTLPLSTADEIAAAERSDRTRANITHLRSAGSMNELTIVCIDNEQTILDGMRALLGTWGCNVITASTPDEAIDALEKSGSESLDLVLADYHLDEMTGPNAAEQIFESVGREVPAIIITADRSPEVQDDIHRAGHVQLRKPVRPAALRALITQCLRQLDAAE